MFYAANLLWLTTKYHIPHIEIMEVPMRKRLIEVFGLNTPEYVVLHGLSRLARRQELTKEWRGVTNPNRAFKVALAETIIRNAPTGISAFNYARLLIRIADYLNMPILARLNGVDIIAMPGDNPEALLNRWWRAATGTAGRAAGATIDKAGDFVDFVLRRSRDEDTQEHEEIGELPTFGIIEPEAWAEILADVDDHDQIHLIQYMARWAHMMEDEMDQGSPLEEIVEATALKADTEGLGDKAFSFAIVVLSSVWTHGEELKNWYDAQDRPDAEKSKSDLVSRIRNRIPFLERQEA